MPLKVHAESGVLGARGEPWSAVGRECHCTGHEFAFPLGSRAKNSLVNSTATSLAYFQMLGPSSVSPAKGEAQALRSRTKKAPYPSRQ